MSDRPRDITQSDGHLAPSQDASLAPEAIQKPKIGNHIAGAAARRISTVLAVVFWTYCFVNIAIVNTDGKFVSYLPPKMTWIVNYKFIIMLVLACLSWLALGTLRFLLLFNYILFFPIVITFYTIWYVGKRALHSRSWIFVFAVVQSAISVLYNLKLKFAMFTLLIVCAFYILVGNSPQIIICAAVALLALILIAYFRGFVAAISPANMFRLIKEYFNKDEDVRFKAFRLDDEIRNTPVTELSPLQIEKWNNVLGNSVIYNRALLFYARTMRDYQRSNLPFIPGLITIFRLLSLTVFGFTLINFAAYKFDKSNYMVSSEAGIFKFFYYSFNALILNGIDDIKPIKIMSQSIFMTQAMLSFFLVAILISLFLSYRTQRASSDLDDAIKVAEREAATMEDYLQREFRLVSINRAIDHLKQAEFNLLSFIHWLSRGI